MVTSRQISKGAIRIVLAPAPAGGWDIVSLSVNGRDVPATRKGEFASDEEAEAAAMARAEAFAKEHQLDARY